MAKPGNQLLSSTSARGNSHIRCGRLVPTVREPRKKALRVSPVRSVKILKLFAAKMVAQIGQFLVSRSLQTNKKSATGRSTTRTPRRSLSGDPSLYNTSECGNIRFR